MTAARAEQGSRPSPLAPFTRAVAALHDAALRRALDQPYLDRLRRGALRLGPDTIELAADATLREAAHRLLTHGWTPTELHDFAAKRVSEPARSYLLDVLAGVGQHSRARGWTAELGRLGARAWWSAGEPHLTQWARRHDQEREDGLGVAVDLLALLAHLPHTADEVVTTPDSPQATAGTLVQDPRIVARIDALFARADDAAYAPEAAACADKAHDLMRRYATVPGREHLDAPAAVSALRRLLSEAPQRTISAVVVRAQRVASTLVAPVRPRPRPRPALPAAAPAPAIGRRA